MSRLGSDTLFVAAHLDGPCTIDSRVTTKPPARLRFSREAAIPASSPDCTAIAPPSSFDHPATGHDPRGALEVTTSDHERPRGPEMAPWRGDHAPASRRAAFATRAYDPLHAGTVVGTAREPPARRRSAHDPVHRAHRAIAHKGPPRRPILAGSGPSPFRRGNVASGVGWRNLEPRYRIVSTKMEFPCLTRS
jgi:hypothetical protein